MATRFNLCFEILAFALLYFAHCAHNAPIIHGDPSYGGIPVRIIREDSNQLVSVSREGALFANGSSSEMATCLLVIPLNSDGRVELASSEHKELVIGLSADGEIIAAPRSELLYYTFEVTSYVKTTLKLVGPENECALNFNDDGVTDNTCFSDDWSGSGTDINNILVDEFDLFTFLPDFVCLNL